MSLKEAYQLAHSAQCRLQMEASAPDRNLRFVVGHLMHYENLRLRIVEMEHAVDMSSRASAVKFRGTGAADGLEVRKKPSTGQLGGRKSPPPPTRAYDPYDDDDIEDDDPWSGGEDDDGEAGDDLGLQRFPSGSARPPQPPPDLVPDEEADDDDDDEEPISPEEPDQETLEKILQTEGSADLANLYDGVRKCPCHKHQDAPAFEKMWELPTKKEGVTRAVAQVFV